MKICAMSDLHGYLPEDIEECELVLICGDISPLNIQDQFIPMKNWLINKFKPWAESLPCDKVIFIAGNHDLFLAQNLSFMYKTFYINNKVTYLCNESYYHMSKDKKSYHVFGTPYCKIFGTWAFMRNDATLEEIYSEIPENLDILLTHDQPYNYGDILLQKCAWNNGEHIGNKPLMEAVLKKQPNWMFSGHLHSTDHSCIEIGQTKRYNVSIKDEHYDPIYKPLILNI